MLWKIQSGKKLFNSHKFSFYLIFYDTRSRILSHSLCRLAKNRTLLILIKLIFTRTCTFTLKLKTYLEPKTSCIIVVLSLWFGTWAFFVVTQEIVQIPKVPIIEYPRVRVVLVLLVSSVGWFVCFFLCQVRSHEKLFLQVWLVSHIDNVIFV